MSAASGSVLGPGEGVQAWRISAKKAMQSRVSDAPRTNEDVRNAREGGLEERLAQRSVYDQICGLSACKSRIRAYKHFIDVRKHQSEKNGRPIDTNKLEGMVKIAQIVMLEWVERAQRVKTLSDGTEVTVNVKVQSLKTKTSDLQILLDMEWGMAPRAEDVASFWRAIHKYRRVLRRDFGLKNSALRKKAIYSQDIAIMISAVIRRPVDGDIAVQNIVHLLLLLHTAGRPSSFMPGSITNFVLDFSDVEWVTRRDTTGKVLALDVIIRMRNFKGYGLNNTDRLAKTLYLYIRSVRQASNLVFDLGLALLAHAIRCGFFGPTATPQTIMQMEPVKFQVLPAHLSSPVLFAHAARGMGLDYSRPMRYDSARTVFSDLCGQSGIFAAEEEILGQTSVRRGTATRLSQAFGHHDARLMLGHNPGSTSLEKSYDLSLEQHDVMSAVIPGEARSYIAPRDQGFLDKSTQPAASIDLARALDMDPKIRLYTLALEHLTICILNETDDWLEIAPYNEIEGSKAENAEDMLLYTRQAIKNRLKSLKLEASRARQSVEVDRRASLTLEDRLRNAQDYHQALTDLPQALLKAWTVGCGQELVSRPVMEAARASATASSPLTLFLGDSDLGLRNGDGDEDWDDEDEIDEHGDVVVAKAGLTEETSVLQDFEMTVDVKGQWLNVLVKLRGHREDARDTVRCSQCRYEDNDDPEMADKEYSNSYLRRHILSYHSHGAVLARWMDQHKTTLPGIRKIRYDCPACSETYTTPASFREHIVAKHGHQIGRHFPAHIIRTLIGLSMDKGPGTRGYNQAKRQEIHLQDHLFHRRLDISGVGLPRKRLGERSYVAKMRGWRAATMFSLVNKDVAHMVDLGRRVGMGQYRE